LFVWFVLFIKNNKKGIQSDVDNCKNFLNYVQKLKAVQPGWEQSRDVFNEWKIFCGSWMFV